MQAVDEKRLPNRGLIAQYYSYTQELAIHAQCLYCTGLLFWRAFCQPCDVTIKRMAPIEGTNLVAMT